MAPREDEYNEYGCGGCSNSDSDTATPASASLSLIVNDQPSGESQNHEYDEQKDSECESDSEAGSDIEGSHFRFGPGSKARLANLNTFTSCNSIKCKLMLVVWVLTIVVTVLITVVVLMSVCIAHLQKQQNTTTNSISSSTNVNSSISSNTMSSSKVSKNIDNLRSEPSSTNWYKDFEYPAALTRVSKHYRGGWLKDLDFADAPKDLNEFLTYQCNPDKDFGAIYNQDQNSNQKQNSKVQKLKKQVKVEKLVVVMRHGARTMCKGSEKHDPSHLWPPPTFLSFLDDKDQDLGASHSCDKTGQTRVDMTFPVLDNGQSYQKEQSNWSIASKKKEKKQKRHQQLHQKNPKEKVFHFDAGYFDRPSSSPQSQDTTGYPYTSTKSYAKFRKDYSTREYEQTLRGTCGLGELTNDGCEMEANNGKRIAQAYLNGSGSGTGNGITINWGLVKHPSDIYIRTDVDGSLRTQQSWYCFVRGLFGELEALNQKKSSKSKSLSQNWRTWTLSEKTKTKTKKQGTSGNGISTNDDYVTKVYLEDSKFQTQGWDFGDALQATLNNFLNWLYYSSSSTESTTTQTKIQKQDASGSGSTLSQSQSQITLNKSIAAQSQYFNPFAIKEQIISFLKSAYWAVYLGKESEDFAAGEFGVVNVGVREYQQKYGQNQKLKQLQQQKVVAQVLDQEKQKENKPKNQKFDGKVIHNELIGLGGYFSTWMIHSMCPTVVDGLSYDKNQLWNNTKYIPYLSQGLDVIRWRLRKQVWRIRNTSAFVEEGDDDSDSNSSSQNWNKYKALGVDLASLTSDDALWASKKTFYQNWWSTTATRQVMDLFYWNNYLYMYPLHLIGPFVHDLLYDVEHPDSPPNKWNPPKKLLLYSNHDTTLDPLVSLLQLDIPKWQQAAVGFGAYVLFEIGTVVDELGDKHEESHTGDRDTKVVRIVFNGKVRRSLLKILDDNKISLLDGATTKDSHDYVPEDYVYRWEDLTRVLKSF